MTLLAVFVESGGGHDVHPVVLPRDELLASRSHPVQQAERAAVLAGPERPVGTVLDEGHPLLERRRGIGREDRRIAHWQIDVAVGGNPLVFHRLSSLGTQRFSRRSSNGAVYG